MMYQEPARVLANHRVTGSYFQLDLACPQTAAAAAPGQFIHLRMPFFEHRLLRRPFSIFDASPTEGRVSVIYKIVGEGTAHLAQLPATTQVDVLGPLGRGFTIPAAGSRPVLVAGGYGCAATYLLARRSPIPPLCLFGARSAADLLLTAEFQALGCEMRIATDDGSVGHRGLVTDLLRDVLTDAGPPPVVFACGPNPMLKAVSTLVLGHGLDAEISLDHAMCCGVGACFACVVRIRKASAPDGWYYARTCTEGPVFLASQALWD